MSVDLFYYSVHKSVIKVHYQKVNS